MARFSYRCALRWSDLDAYGHVNNARFLTLYEEARIALMFTDARKAGLTSFESGVVIARQEVDYLRPVDYRAAPPNRAGTPAPDGTPAPAPDGTPAVRIELWIAELRPSRFTIAYELFDADRVASRALTVCVPFDLAAGRPRRLTDVERDYLTPWRAG